MGEHAGRTTPAIRDRIAALRERNWSLAAIAAATGLSRGTVAYWCLVRGAEPRKVSPTALPRRDGPVRRRTGVVHPFTAEDDALLSALALQNHTASEIARVLTKRDPARPRKPNTVTARLMTLARQAARAAARAA